MVWYRDDQFEWAGNAPVSERAQQQVINRLASLAALYSIFQDREFPLECAIEALDWKYDRFGKPFIEWTGAIRRWSDTHDLHFRNAHVSNTNDGDPNVPRCGS